MMSRVARFTIYCILSCSISGIAETLSNLDGQSVAARRAYDLVATESAYDSVMTYAIENPSEDSNRSLAYAALYLSELRRIVFEEDAVEPAKRRALGKAIDNSAKIGHAALDTLPDTSEKFRIRADLYALMIRTNYQGKKYGKKMEAAQKKALELAPDNPNAHVTASKRLLFATERRGGNLKGALIHLNRACELDATNEMAILLRGIAHEKLGDYEAAKKEWYRVLELNPSSRPATDNLERIRDEGH